MNTSLVVTTLALMALECTHATCTLGVGGAKYKTAEMDPVLAVEMMKMHR